MNLSKLNKYAPIAVRCGVGLVFFLFGIDQLRNPENWFAWTPAFATSVETFWLFNGILDLIVGALLLIGLFIRIISLVAVLHLIGVIYTLGWNDIAIRDFGLLLATISIFFNGADNWCLDRKIFRKKNI